VRKKEERAFPSKPIFISPYIFLFSSFFFQIVMISQKCGNSKKSDNKKRRTKIFFLIISAGTQKN